MPSSWSPWLSACSRRRPAPRRRWRATYRIGYLSWLAAKGLGLTIPPAVLTRATEVID